MESHLSEEALWASGLASRLRLIQANFADDPSSVRQGYLLEEIERALKPVSPTRRKNYLDSLAERFPARQSVHRRVARQYLEEMERLVHRPRGQSLRRKGSHHR